MRPGQAVSTLKFLALRPPDVTAVSTNLVMNARSASRQGSAAGVEVVASAVRAAHSGSLSFCLAAAGISAAPRPQSRAPCAARKLLEHVFRGMSAMWRQVLFVSRAMTECCPSHCLACAAGAHKTDMHVLTQDGTWTWRLAERPAFEMRRPLGCRCLLPLHARSGSNTSSCGVVWHHDAELDIISWRR